MNTFWAILVTISFQLLMHGSKPIVRDSQKTFLGDKDTIHWSSAYRLTYDDFQGTPKPNGSSDRDTLAVCAYTIKYKVKMIERDLKIESFAVFERNNSWIKEKSVWVLDHEQGHFDIGEIFALRFEKKVNHTVIKDVHEFLDFLNTSFKETAAECNAEQEKYDIQMMNTLGKQYYSKWIKEQLDSLAKGR